MVAQGKEAPRHLYDVVEKAGEAGTIAHDMIEAFILGKPTPTIAASDDVIAKASNAFQQFGEWHGAITYRNHRHRALVCIRALPVRRHCRCDWPRHEGTCRTARLEEFECRLTRNMLIQLAAYALLLEECASDWTPKGFHLLRVAKESATSRTTSLANSKTPNAHSC